MKSEIIDMHHCDILAAIRKRGSSMRRLSIENGLAPTTLRNVFYRPWPKGEAIIATFLETKPSSIWPSRYPDDKAA